MANLLPILPPTPQHFLLPQFFASNQQSIPTKSSILKMSSAQHYKLFYFDFAGRVEPIRLLLHYVGQPFDNVTIKIDDWHAGTSKYKKTDFKYGQMPVLEIDGGIRLAQTMAILRYLAEKYNLMGKGECEKAMADELVELHRDFIEAILPYMGAHGGWGGPVDVAKLHEEVFVPSLRRFMPLFENALNKAGSGFLLPSGISYADFVFAHIGDFLEWMEPDCLKDYPVYAAYIGRMRALPQLSEHFANLPINYHSLRPGMPFKRAGGE